MRLGMLTRGVSKPIRSLAGIGIVEEIRCLRGDYGGGHRKSSSSSLLLNNALWEGVAEMMRLALTL